MALKQTITSVSGVATEYHRIGTATVNYTERKAYITVLSYLEPEKREEEKTQAKAGTERDVLMKELNELVMNATDENEAHRIELSNQVNALPIQTPDDVAPRHVSEITYEIELLDDIDFNLAFAYNWLKENIYTSSENC